GTGITTRVAPASIVSGLANVTTAELTEAASGGSQVAFTSSSGPVFPIKASPLTANGKPLVLYVGAEYCPFCAATRWALVVALDKFGSFSGLDVTASSPVDFAPNTHTLSFVNAKYHSQYLAFESIEELGNSCSSVSRNPNPPPAYVCNSLADYQTLQRPDAAQSRLLSTYDSARYVGQANAGAIPFIDIGNRWIEAGAPYAGSTGVPPSSLSGLSWQQIVNTLSAPISGSPGQAILGAANHYIAAFCNLISGSKPAICHAAIVTAVEKTIQ
ncbi:MAG: DUF929 family protein, partial [Actinomycetota bacterium]|nr:DUF929 family protein [Actinomycetota bacterium]